MGTYEDLQNRDCHGNPSRRHTKDDFQDDGSNGTPLPNSDPRPPLLKSSTPNDYDCCHRRNQRKFNSNDMVNEADDERGPDETIKDIQQELNEVVDIIRESLDRILEEDEKIEDLDKAAENIITEAKVFKHIGKKLIVRNHWRRNRHRYGGLAVLLMVGTFIAGAMFVCRPARM